MSPRPYSACPTLRRILPLTAAALLACGSGQQAGPERKTSATIVVVGGVTHDVDQLRLTVSGSDLPSPVVISQDWNGETPSVTVEGIPVGSNRTLVFELFDTASSATEPVLTGTTMVPVVTPENNSVAITLQPTEPPPRFANAAPVIHAVFPSTQGVVEIGSTIRLEVVATDDDSEQDPSILWLPEAGSVSSTDDVQTDWTAPLQPGEYLVRVQVFDDVGMFETEITMTVVGLQTITWKGQQWRVKSATGDEELLGPGPNRWSNLSDAVFIDNEDCLHLAITQRNGAWHSAEVIGTDPVGYGLFRFAVKKGVESLDPNVVAGLFTFLEDPDQPNEIDIEFTEAFLPPSPQGNGYFTVQGVSGGAGNNIHAYDLSGNDFSEEGDMATFSFLWQRDSVEFAAHHGGLDQNDNPDRVIIEEWTYPDAAIPVPADETALIRDTVRINLWQFEGKDPINTNPEDPSGRELVVCDYAFEPIAPGPNTTRFSDDFLAPLADGLWNLDRFFEDGLVQDRSALGEVWFRVGIEDLDLSEERGMVTTMPISRTGDNASIIYRMRLREISVDTTRPGADVRAILAAVSQEDSPLRAPGAATLAVDYDAQVDSLTLSLFTKTDDPGARGALVYSGRLSDANQGQDLTLELSLDATTFRIRVLDNEGKNLPLSGTNGTARGPHMLGANTLRNGYFAIGGEHRVPDTATGDVGKGFFFVDSVSVSPGPLL